VGIVHYSQTAHTLCKLTNDEGRIGSCISRVGAIGGSAPDVGLREALRELADGRAPGLTPAAHQVLVLFADGLTEDQCPALLTAAREVREDLVRLLTFAIRPGDTAPCLRASASAPRYFFEAPAPSLAQVLETLVQPIGEGSGQPLVQSLRLHEELAPGLRVVPDSIAPRPGLWTDRQIDWGLGPILSGEAQASYRVQPEREGDFPVLSAGYGQLDVAGAPELSFQFPDVRLSVVAPGALPTPSAFPTPGPTPTRTSTPVVTSTAQAPAASPTPATTPVAALPCPGLSARVPAAAMGDALANPERVAGWNQPCPPPSSGAPGRRWLGLRDPAKPYQPLSNWLAYKCGCP
jgi:hypothetical protein